jgi:spermidine dehydrogenase
MPGEEPTLPNKSRLHASTSAGRSQQLSELVAKNAAELAESARDIAAITVNRWPHGYAYHYNSLYDSFWMDGGPLPCVIARQPYGRVAIANADSDAFAYTHVAIEQAHRAIDDLGIQVRAA